MAANITDLQSRVTDSNTGRPVITQLASPGKAIGAASVNIQSATNWTTTSAIYFAIYQTMTVGNVTVKDPTTQTDWKGTLSGTTISNLTLTGGADRAYTAGAIIELTDTARQAKDDYDWKIARHNQDGSHKAFTESNIIPSTAIQDGAITTTKILDSNVTTAKLADTSVTSAKMSLSKTVDANGWTVYDYGSWKEYRKQSDASPNPGANSNLTFIVSSLPVGVNETDVFIDYHWAIISGSANWYLAKLIDTSGTNLRVNIANTSGSTGSMTIRSTLHLTQK